MRGSIAKRGKDSWRLRFDVGAHPDGRRKVASITVRGARRQAEAELRKRLGTVDEGTYVERSKATVGTFVRERIDLWQAAGDIGAKCFVTYVQLLNRQIAPHIGGALLQKLTTTNIERWHGA